jgi:hypothetical protein
MTVKEEHERTKLRTTSLSQTRLTDRNGTVVENTFVIKATQAYRIV